MDPRRRYVAEGEQHESTFVKARMGQLQPRWVTLGWSAPNQLTKCQQIEVDSPSDVWRAANTSHLGFDGVKPL